MTLRYCFYLKNRAMVGRKINIMTETKAIDAPITSQTLLMSCESNPKIIGVSLPGFLSPEIKPEGSGYVIRMNMVPPTTSATTIRNLIQTESQLMEPSERRVFFQKCVPTVTYKKALRLG